LAGQDYIKSNINFLEKEGYKVIYSDTDSLFLTLKPGDDVKTLIGRLNKFCEFLSLQRNAIKSTVEFAHDKGFSKWFICAKKRYAGYLTFLDGKYLKEPKLYVAGLEYKRTDVCKYVKKTQEQLIRRILDAKEMTYAEVRTLVDQCKQYIIKGDVQLEDIIIGQKLTKSKEDYETETMHLAVVDEMIKDNKEVYVGDKILYYIESIDKEGKGIPRPVYKYKNSFARVYYWNKKIYPALFRILEVVFPKVSWDSYFIGTKGNKKEKFFGKTDLWD
jgi:DNA polymerase elongation subunit (family B)